jgi:hypothetical protein
MYRFYILSNPHIPTSNCHHHHHHHHNNDNDDTECETAKVSPVPNELEELQILLREAKERKQTRY